MQYTSLFSRTRAILEVIAGQNVDQNMCISAKRAIHMDKMLIEPPARCTIREHHVRQQSNLNHPVCEGGAQRTAITQRVGM